MTNRPNVRGIRIPTPLWELFGNAVDDHNTATYANTDRSKIINQFISWYVGAPGGQLPTRPTDIP